MFIWIKWLISVKVEPVCMVMLKYKEIARHGIEGIAVDSITIYTIDLPKRGCFNELS